MNAPADFETVWNKYHETNKPFLFPTILNILYKAVYRSRYIFYGSDSGFFLNMCSNSEILKLSKWCPVGFDVVLFILL
jgi:hypothetical protein